MANAADIVSQVRLELNDDSKVTFTDADMLLYLNAAQHQIVLVRPDAYSAIESLVLTAGETKHSLASDQLRLLGVIRNMGSDGTTPGKPIRMVDFASHQLYDQKWHTATGKTTIRDVMYNENTPTYLFTDPPAHATTTVYIEVSVSKAPPNVTDVATGALALSHIYEQPLRQYMLHMAYAKEIESEKSTRKSRAYLQDFYNSLGLKTKVDAMYSPSKGGQS